MTFSAPFVPPPGAHGGDAPAVARALGIAPDELLDLSQNLNPLAPHPRRTIAAHLDSLTRYPDPGPATHELAAALGAAPEQVLLTNGGSEAIHLVAAELGGGARSEPEFGLHPRSPDGPRWRSDPHSPSGHLAAGDQRADVWDEAFYALATGRWGSGRWDDADAPVVVGSLTKTFACPGLRLGYVVADPDLLRRLQRRQPHWSVSTLALDALPDLLAGADLTGWAAGIRTLRSDLVDLLHSHGLSVEPADAPWVLVRETGLRERLAPQGVLVRDCTSFGMPGVARVAVPTSQGLVTVARALDRAAAQASAAG